jgi:prepilin-type N-terminal cleavage/methylation domain-containing protein/prepilin-type processing-associated H-X9-DG protein
MKIYGIPCGWPTLQARSMVMENYCFIKRAFTLVELLIVLAVISILGCLLLPAMARTRITSSGAGCLSGLRQMMVGWNMYKDDNNDNLIPNNDGSQNGWIGNTCTENWSTDTGNTNVAAYQAALLGPYVNGHVEIYRCPADTIPSQNGVRIRSRSMNSQMSPPEGPGGSVANPNEGWRTYFRGSDLTCPTPQNAFIFADESMASLNDGWLEMDLVDPSCIDIPANYHDSGCGISFADGHAEIHKWMWPGTATSGLRNAPYVYGDGYPSYEYWGSSGSDPDWLWLRARTACNHP